MLPVNFLKYQTSLVIYDSPPIFSLDICLYWSVHIRLVHSDVGSCIYCDVTLCTRECLPKESSLALHWAFNQAEKNTIPRTKTQPFKDSPAVQHTWSLRVGNKSTFRNLNASTGITETTVVRRMTSQMHFWVKECRAFPIVKGKYTLCL